MKFLINVIWVSFDLSYLALYNYFTPFCSNKNIN